MATSLITSGQPDNYGLGGTAARTGATDSNTTSSGATTGNTNQSGTTTASGNSTSNTSSNSTTDTRNMSSANEAALNRLIQMLMGGGTPEMRQQQARRDAETGAVQDIRAGYSKNAAFGDAQGLISQQMRRALESMLPSINRAAEDAGSSGGALRALLLQDAANKAAESSSALGVQTAVQYGGISANLSGVLEGLTRVNPVATEALINALNVAKGAVTTSTTTGNQTTNTNTNNTSTTNSNTNTNGTSTASENKDYAPFVQKDYSPIYYGPENSPASGTGVGSTLDTLMQLAKDTSWSGYTF